jgi:hypothetical protein
MFLRFVMIAASSLEQSHAFTHRQKLPSLKA